MLRSLRALVALGALALPWAAAARAEPPVPRGDRLLSIDLTLPESDDFEAAFALAVDSGMQVTSLPVAWENLEPERGVYDGELLSIANLFYSATGTPLNVDIKIIDTNNLVVPGYLQGVAFDDPLMAPRFRRLLNFVRRQLRDVDVLFLGIGNEVDAYLADPVGWEAYRVFFEAVAPRARKLFPKALVGVPAQFSGLTGGARRELMDLNSTADAVFVTYYPLEPDFTVRPVWTVRRDFNRMVALYPDKPIAFVEAGYPSGALNRSSKQKQKRFVERIFAAWDRHAERIPLVSFTWLHDIPDASVEEFLDYYGLADPGFASYLATLGLRNYAGNGSPKPAFHALRKAARERGW